MHKREITYVIKDTDGDIIQVGIKGEITAVKALIQQWMDNRPLDLFVVDEHGNEVDVDIRARDKKFYLTTQPDGILLNNLDYLTICK